MTGNRPKLHRIQPDVTARARQLRHDAPIPERILWGVLRDRRLADYKFRRQHPLGPFFADYCCPRARLVIELDGMTHDARAKQDAQRTRIIESLGYRVIRFTNDDLLKHREAVALTILNELQRITPPLPPRERAGVRVERTNTDKRNTSSHPNDPPSP
ncbi:MAG: endonuclease domain-containing protein [Phycisphaerales bacterium]